LAAADMPEATRFFIDHADNGTLAWRWQVIAAERFQLSLPQVEKKMLEAGILPKRYQRNQSAISTEEQLVLFNSHAAVVGCGGLGCYVVEELARTGVGTITVIDPDFFEEHNLNRQLFSTSATLGMAKVEAAAGRIAAVNPSIHLVPVQERFGKENGRALLQGVTVVVDALDNIATKLELAATCNQLALPLVFGAIAGWYGYVASQHKGDDVVSRLYQGQKGRSGIEQQQGNLACTAATVAGFQVAEACKMLLGKKTGARGRMLAIDLLEMEFDAVEM
jgi:molybdopterin/thiamine biosynthesis adenylyltransferase